MADAEGGWSLVCVCGDGQMSDVRRTVRAEVGLEVHGRGGGWAMPRGR